MRRPVQTSLSLAAIAILVALAGEQQEPAYATAAKSVQGTGEQVYRKWCAACHSDGVNYAGTVALQAKYNGELPAVLDQRTDLDEATITYFVRNGVSVMPMFRKTEISDQQMKELTKFLMKKRK